MTEREHDWAALGIDVTRPSIARAYDYALGGKDNYAPDRGFIDQLNQVLPEVTRLARDNRAALRRGVRHMAETGIRQFLDLGSGLPTVENTHQVAQAVAPESAVVYVDNDPIVLAHGRALLAENERTTVVTADLREPAAVLAHPEVNRHLDLTRPVGVMLVGVLNHLHDQEDPRGIVRAYMDAVPSGSLLFMTTFVDVDPASEELEKAFLGMLGTGRFRSFEETLTWLEGLEILEPGLVHIPEWRPDGPVGLPLGTIGRLGAAALARKP
ncbi:SAM-dependent methyltransferase [Actinomadura kijaniata]|uniref:SAM-dependent methyltransferase n=1 Tax=Actinomadura namibiensis TaxID=182080 RepID=A0A7W3LJS0_ACTNM|nr:SAM-dependent methyltransferase [Actinomadura namibiensis]MBA8949429.1 SAM-dependent methyltransferase [Actinomadura namibiensis]